MKLSFCNIIKDDSELPRLKKLMASVKDYVDTIHITATGKKVSGIKKYVEKNGWDYSFFKWCDDFSAARNYNFSRAPKDSDYIFWLDTDDLLVGGHLLRKVATVAKDTGKTAVFFTYWYGCQFDGEPSFQTLTDVELHHPRERLLKPGTVTWKNRLHETPVPVLGTKENYTQLRYLPNEKTDFPIAVLHTHADRNLDKKSLDKRMERNQRLLELQLSDERAKGKADPRTLLYLMKIYSQKDDPELWSLCIDMGYDYLQSSGWDEERAVCYENMARCFGKAGDNAASEQLLLGAIKEWPFAPVLYLMLAQTYFNLRKFNQMKHWMDVAAKIDNPRSAASMQNELHLKMLSAELAMNYYFNAKRNTKKALKAAEMLYEINPDKIIKEKVNTLYDINELNEACLHVDKLVRYLSEVGDIRSIEKILKAIPEVIQKQPFIYKHNHRFLKPRVWGEKEICYFANFGAKHFEEWTPKNLESGIGGSETAVIELSKEWTKLGFKVTVFGDPGKAEGVYDGVEYLPFYAFNIRDKFNILIQWRNGTLADKVSTKKFYVDLHDVWADVDYLEKIDCIDKIFVKSEYHRRLSKGIQDDKFAIISNGIRT